VSKLLGAIMINPWNLKEIKNAIRTALTVSDSQKTNDHSHLLSYVKRFTSSHWGKTFVEDLTSCYDARLQLTFATSFISNENVGEKVKYTRRGILY
jgi:trehalose-6-phosphate synthase